MILSRFRAGLVIAATLLAACSVGPDYVQPQTAVTDSGLYRGLSRESSDESSRGKGGSIGKGASKAVARSAWWESFDDRLLNEWVGRLLAENLTLRSTAERVVQAQERAVISGGERWPSLGISTDGRRSFGDNPVSSGRLYQTEANLSLGISWQADLFGKVRRSIESAEYQALANEADYQALQHSLITELVRLRASVAISLQEVAVQTDIVKSRKRTLDTVQRRYKLGVKNSSVVDVHVADENVASAQAQLVVLERELKESFLSLDLLLNQKPGTLEKVGADFPLLPVGEVNTGLPAALLDQRPDIRGHEFRLMAANANVGVAMAELFPDLTLSVNQGFSSNEWAGLLTNSNALGFIAGQLTARLFEGGRLRAQIRLRESELREQVLEYSKTVLNAFSEVEKALLQERYLTEQVMLLQRGVSAARKAETLAEERYQQGISSLLVLLDVQRRRQNAERSLLATKRTSWQVRANLHLALGGGWLIEKTDKVSL